MKKLVVILLIVAIVIVALLTLIYYFVDHIDDSNLIFSIMRIIRHDQILAEITDEEWLSIARDMPQVTAFEEKHNDIEISQRISFGAKYMEFNTVINNTANRLVVIFIEDGSEMITFVCEKPGMIKPFVKGEPSAEWIKNNTCS